MFCAQKLFLIVVAITFRAYGLGQEGVDEAKRSQGPNDDVTFDCTYMDDGFYADVKRDCHQYYHCYQGIKATYRCPPGSLFDKIAESCNRAEYVQCSQLSVPPELRSQRHRAHKKTKTRKQGEEYLDELERVLDNLVKGAEREEEMGR